MPTPTPDVDQVTGTVAPAISGSVPSVELIAKDVVGVAQVNCVTSWPVRAAPVSYTHLDVYKRQCQSRPIQD